MKGKPSAIAREPDRAEAFRAYIAQQGLRGTRQRMAVYEAARGLAGHYTADELLRKARQLDDTVSRATGDRPLPLLGGCGAVREVDVGRDHTYYLTESGGASFRAQLICERCETIIPVEAPFMEWYGKAVAAKHGMRPVSQRLQVNAICADCQKRESLA
ncbi:MAG: Fur family transcriptional regulator [Opitutia bacterium]